MCTFPEGRKSAPVGIYVNGGRLMDAGKVLYAVVDQINDGED